MALLSGKGEAVESILRRMTHMHGKDTRGTGPTGDSGTLHLRRNASGAALSLSEILRFRPDSK